MAEISSRHLFSTRQITNDWPTMLVPPGMQGSSIKNSNYILFPCVWQQWEGRGNWGLGIDVSVKSMEMFKHSRCHCYQHYSSSTDYPKRHILTQGTIHLASCLAQLLTLNMVTETSSENAREYTTWRHFAKDISHLKEDIRKRHRVEKVV
jgi:hypothetical protein